MQYLKLRLLAFFKGFWTESLFRGKDHVGFPNLHGKYEIWFNRINKRYVAKHGGVLSHKAGIGETFDKAVQDALGDYHLKRDKPAQSFDDHFRKIKKPN